MVAREYSLLDAIEALMPADSAVKRTLTLLSMTEAGADVTNLVEGIETRLRAKLFDVAYEMLSKGGQEGVSNAEVAKLLRTPKSTVERFPHITEGEIITRATSVRTRVVRPRKAQRRRARSVVRYS